MYNIKRYVLQEQGTLLGECLIVKNQWAANVGSDFRTYTHARGKCLGVHLGVYKRYFCLKTGIIQ